VAEQLAKLEEVQFVSVVAGRYNIAADVSVGSNQELLAFFDKLNSINGIISYDTQVILKLLKAQYDYIFI
jgi:Lrp/AsnC family transcriptional regulator for asnA, asnC and gidA